MRSRSIKIDFQNPARLIMDQEVSGAEALGQQACCLVATRQGSCATFPQAGTTLLRDGIRMVLRGRNQIQHAINFAAIQTLFFIRQHDRLAGLDNVDRIATVRLEILEMGWPLRLRLSVETTRQNSITQTPILA